MVCISERLRPESRPRALNLIRTPAFARRERVQLCTRSLTSVHILAAAPHHTASTRFLCPKKFAHRRRPTQRKSKVSETRDVRERNPNGWVSRAGR